MTTITYIELGDAAEGTIQAGPAQQERLDEFTNDVGAGQYHVATATEILCGCIDGRGGSVPRPDSAGGSETLMVADDLTGKRFAGHDGTTLSAYENTLAYVTNGNRPIGGHTGPHATIGQSSDCGANDKLEKIYTMIVAKAETIRSITETYLGVPVLDKDHERIITNVKARQSFSSGAELLQVLADKHGDIDHLNGDHQEVVAVINKRYGTTLDRQAVEAVYGTHYEAFNVDVWAFAKSAAFISPGNNESEINARQVAMAYYNVATALVLCGPSMRVVVLR